MTIYLLSKDTLKTFCQGALGAMTFGMYHQYTTNKIMELNNEKQDLKYYIEMERRDKEIQELREHIERLENKRWFW